MQYIFNILFILHFPDYQWSVIFVYSISMQPVGQVSTQTPQSTHSSGSTTAISSSFIAIAVAGHSSIHDPQPTHSSALIFAAISYSPKYLVHQNVCT